jgi:hypothetical protein
MTLSKRFERAGVKIEYPRINRVGENVAYSDKLDITNPVIENFVAKYLKP